MLAIILGLFASFWFAASMILINRGVLAIDYFRGLLTNLGVNALFLWLYVVLFVDSIDLGTPANLIFVLVGIFVPRSEEHTSELQSQSNLVCRLLLEKKKKNTH